MGPVVQADILCIDCCETHCVCKASLYRPVILSDLFFPNPFDPDSALSAAGNKPKVTRRIWVHPNLIGITQKWVFPDILGNYIKTILEEGGGPSQIDADESNSIWAIEYNGLYYIQNGHHRMAALMLIRPEENVFIQVDEGGYC